MLILIIAGGPDKGRIYELQEGNDVILGREGDQIALNDRKCSRKHAKLWCEGGKWYLQDLDSTHGTFRNHKKIEHQAALKDGDYLQVGSTVMVLARMNALMAERAALLGDAEPATPLFTPKTARLLIGGGAVAAAVLLGLNVATYFQATQGSQGTDQLQSQLAAVAQDPQRAAFESEVRDLLAQGQLSAGEMSQMLASLGPDQDRFRRELGRQLDTVLAAVENDEQAQVLVAKLDGVLGAMRQQGGQTAAMADRVLAALDDQPSADQLAEATAKRVARAVQPLDPQVAADLADAAQRLASAETVGNQITELRDLVEKVPGQLAQPMTRVLAQLETLADNGSQTDQQRQALLAAVESLRAQLPPDPTGQLNALTDRLAALPTLGDLEALERRDAQRLSTLSAMLGQPGDADQAFAQSLESLQQQLAQVATKLEQRDDQTVPTQITEQLAALSEKLDQRDRPDADSLANIQAQLSDVRDTLAALPAANVNADDEPLREQLARIGDQLADRRDTQAMQEQLTTILTELKDRDDAGLIKQQLEALAANQPAAPDPVLAQILASVQERAQAQTLAQADTQRRLDELAARLETTPYTNTALIDEIVAALPESAPAIDPDSLVASITDKLAQQQALTPSSPLADPDQLRQLIRTEVLASVHALGEQLQAGNANLARATAQDELDPALAVDEDGLTRVEQAYKLAFQTGQPLTIGAGQVDPRTGIASAGRRLDPDAARAAGMEHWRDWYLMDDLAHRMRLTREASRVRGTLGDPSIINLPGGNTIYAAPPVND